MPELAVAKQIDPRSAAGTKSASLLVLLLFSIVYFLDALIRGSGKAFWFDEFFTVSFSRLSSLAALWAALKSGIDFNPPSFYLLTSLSEKIFGSGLIGTRMPEILGFWLLSLCLFRFVRRRVGLLGGTVAMLLPALSGAFFYAYEARPHGIVLGCCGLALVCWQMAQEQPHASKWRAGLSCSLLAAFLMHCYALVVVVPFLSSEAFKVYRTRRINWSMWVALCAPAVLACVLYIPLLLSFQKANGGGALNSLFPASWIQVQHFYITLLSRSVVVIVAGLVLLAADQMLRPQAPPRSRPEGDLLDMQEVVLGLAFLALPVFGIALGKIIHGPFFARYFLSALAGVCLMLGIGIGRSRPWIGGTMAALTAAMFLADVAGVIVRRVRHQPEFLVEPSTHITLNTTPGDPFGLHPVWKANAYTPGFGPIGVLNSLEYTYLVHYAPDLRSRLYFVTRSRRTLEYGGLSSYRPWSADPYNAPATFEEFARTYSHFLIYGEKGMFDRLAALTRLGARIDWIKADDEHFLVGMQGVPEARH